MPHWPAQISHGICRPLTDPSLRPDSEAIASLASGLRLQLQALCLAGNAQRAAHAQVGVVHEPLLSRAVAAALEVDLRASRGGACHGDKGEDELALVQCGEHVLLHHREDGSGRQVWSAACMQGKHAEQQAADTPGAGRPAACRTQTRPWPPSRWSAARGEGAARLPQACHAPSAADAPCRPPLASAVPGPMATAPVAPALVLKVTACTSRCECSPGCARTQSSPRP